MSYYILIHKLAHIAQQHPGIYLSLHNKTLPSGAQLPPNVKKEPVISGSFEMTKKVMWFIEFSNLEKLKKRDGIHHNYWYKLQLNLYHFFVIVFIPNR